MVYIWKEGSIEEYSNGFFAKVVAVVGHFALLKELPDERDPARGGEYFVARAEYPDKGDGDFPWCYAEEGEDGDLAGEPRRYSNRTVGELALVAVSVSSL